MPTSGWTASWFTSVALSRIASLAWLLFAGAAQGAVPPHWAGRPVAELLAELSRAGIEIIYSTELVPPTLRIVAEPDAASLIDQARAALAARGLQLVEVAPGHFAVTRAAARATPPRRRPPKVAVVDAPQPQFDEVAVYGNRISLDAHGLALPSSVSREDASNGLGTRNDVLRATQTLPGVATASASLPYVRGSLPEDVLVSFDHVAIADPFHLQGFQRLISVFDSAVIQQVDVYTGGFPVRYGERSGGVVEIAPRSLVRGMEIGVDVGTRSVGASTVGHAQGVPLDWLFSLRDNSIDLRRRAVGSGTRQSDLLDFIGRVRWQSSDDVAWTLGALTLGDRIRLHSASSGQDATGDSRNVHAWLVREQSLAGDWHSEVVLDGAHESFQQTGGQGYGAQYNTLLQSRQFDTWTANARWFDASPGRTGWDIGVRAFQTDGRNFYRSRMLPRPPWQPVTGLLVPIDLAQSLREAGGGGYAAYRRQLGDRLDMELGLRFDTQHDVGESTQAQWSPRVNVQWRAAPQLTVHGSIGRYAQAQRPDEWRVEAAQSRADPAQLMDAAILGVASSDGGGTRWSAEVYRKRWLQVSPYFDNLFNPQALTPALSPDRVRIVPTSAAAEGVELAIQRDLPGAVRVWANTTVSTVADEIAGQRVPRSWDQRWSANAGINWSASRINLAAVIRTHQGWPRTPFDPLIVPPRSTPTWVRGARNSARWGTYASADARASWLVPWPLGTLEAWAEVTNLFNRGNPCCLGIRVGPDGLPVMGSILDWQPRTYEIGASWRFKAP